MFLSKKKQFDEQFHYFKIRKTSTINITYEPSLLRDAVSFSIAHIQKLATKDGIFTMAQNFKAERQMISDSLSSVFLRDNPTAHKLQMALFSPIVYIQDDSNFPKPSPNHSHDREPCHLIIYKVAHHHCGIPVAFVY